MQQIRLARSPSEKVVAGVCGGIGIYFGVDPVIVRLIFVVLTVTTGVAILVYPVLWAVMPRANQSQTFRKERPSTGQTINLRLDEAPSAQYVPPQQQAASRQLGDRWRNILGIVLMSFGILIFADQLGFHLDFIWPLVLVGLGIWLLRRP